MKTKVALITTGGTIASKETSTGKLESGKLTGLELANLCNLPSDIEVEIYSTFQLPSPHITFSHLLELKQLIEQIYQDSSINGIVLTHGTDTLEETSYFLDLTIQDDRPIVTTGSQRPPNQLGSDSYVNIRHAIYVACNEHMKGIGTVVVFNERIFSARYIKKVHASNIQGFDVFGFGYFGIVDNDKVYVYQKPINRDTFTIINKIPEVDIIKTYLGANGKFIDAAEVTNVKGIVIEGVGRGQVTPSMMDSIQKALDKGIHIVLTTGAEEGQVYATYDYNGSAYDLFRRGVLMGKDYDSKKARMKLSIALASTTEVNQSIFDN